MLLDVAGLEYALQPLLTFQYPTLPTDSSNIDQARNVRDLICEADDTLSALETLKDQFDTALRTFQRCRASSWNSLAPVMHLPPEILYKVFEYVVGDSARPDDRLSITRICAHWRHVAVSFPKLWSTIRLSDQGNQQEMLEEFLRRSAQARLHLDFRRMHHKDTPRIPLNVDTTLRIASLNVPMDDRDFVVDIPLITPLDLETVTVSLRHNRNNGLWSFPHSIISTRELHLSRLTQSGMPRTLFARLQRLYIRTPSTEALFDFLRSLQAPSLKFLFLHGVEVGATIGFDPLIRGPLLLLEVEGMSFTGRPYPTPLMDICRGFVMPKLKAFTLAKFIKPGWEQHQRESFGQVLVEFVSPASSGMLSLLN